MTYHTPLHVFSAVWQLPRIAAGSRDSGKFALATASDKEPCKCCAGPEGTLSEKVCFKEAFLVDPNSVADANV